MKIIVIGEPCIDVIHRSNGAIIKSYGGILYSVVSLGVLADKDEIIPVMNAGEDEYDNILQSLGRYANIKTDGITKGKHKTRRVNLYYDTIGNRREDSTKPAPSIEYRQIEPYIKEADAILVNMISGKDITLNTLQKLRKNFTGKIHIDIHNIVMKTSGAVREPGAVDNWEAWCSVSDTVQMNQIEAATISGENIKEYEIAERILMNQDCSVKGLIITRGSIGVSGFRKREKNFKGENYTDIDRKDISSVENPHYVDPTGCGDVFAAAFLYDYMHNNDFDKSLHYANRIASFKVSLEGIDQLYKLK